MAQHNIHIAKDVNNEAHLTTDIIQEVNYDDESDPLQQFIFALRAPETKRQYPKRLKVFMDFVKLDGDIKQQAKTLYEKIRCEKDWFRGSLIRFFEFQKERARRKEIEFSTISNYYKALKLFVEMNFDNPVVNWKKISKGIPSGRKSANDRAPTREELKKLSEYPDRRIKPIICLMVSTGIRIGAFDHIQWKHIFPIVENNEVIAAKLIVYPGDNEEYFTFMTSEAYNLLKEWMDYRESHGEKITGESWIMRDLWQTTDMKYGAKFGLSTYPKQLKSLGIKSLLERALRAQGLVKPLNKRNNERRRDWKGAHGLRKYFQTVAEQKMKSINVEILMGHSIGVSGSYYKPSERDILTDFLKVSNFLCLDYDNTALNKQIKELEEENRNNDYIIKGKLREKDEQIKNLTSEFTALKKVIENMISNLGDTCDQNTKNTIAQTMFSSGLIKSEE